MQELTFLASKEPSGPIYSDERCNHRTRALFEPLLIHQRILRQIVDAGLGEWIGVKLLDLRNPEAAQDQAGFRRKRLPARETLHAWDDELFRALSGNADEKTLSLLLATMLDGFPRGMVQNVQTYVQAALLVLGDHAPSPDIFAAAIIRIWRKDRFPPTVAELLDECESARQGAANARRVVAKLIALLDNAEEVLDATGDPGEQRKRDGS
jgi:hypothetical protein